MICMSPPTQLLREPPCEFSICFGYSAIRGVAMKSNFSNDVSMGKVNYDTLLLILYLLPNIPLWCSW